MSFESIGQLQDLDFDKNGNLLTHDFKAGNKPVLIMVQSSHCGWCTKAKPDFARLFQEHKQSKVFLATLQTDSKDPHVQNLMKGENGMSFSKILEKNGIKFNGVPTYILYKNGKYIEYQGGRDYNSLKKFVDSL